MANFPNIAHWSEVDEGGVAQLVRHFKHVDGGQAVGRVYPEGNRVSIRLSGDSVSRVHPLKVARSLRNLDAAIYAVEHIAQANGFVSA